VFRGFGKLFWVVGRGYTRGGGVSRYISGCEDERPGGMTANNGVRTHKYRRFVGSSRLHLLGIRVSNTEGTFVTGET
jgi:hypothetical protein